MSVKPEGFSPDTVIWQFGTGGHPIVFLSGIQRLVTKTMLKE